MPFKPFTKKPDEPEKPKAPKIPKQDASLAYEKAVKSGMVDTYKRAKK